MQVGSFYLRVLITAIHPLTSKTTSASLFETRHKSPVPESYACILCMSRLKHHILYHFHKYIDLPDKYLIPRVLPENTSNNPADTPGIST